MGKMFRDKVSQIEFHITFHELEDFILRAAELIQEGYSLENIRIDDMSFSRDTEPEPPIHIIFVKRG